MVLSIPASEILPDHKVNEVKQTINMYLPSQVTSFYDEGIQHLLSQYDKCLKNSRNYAKSSVKYICPIAINIVWKYVFVIP